MMRFLCLFVCLPLFANPSFDTKAPSIIYFGAYGGYGALSGGYGVDGQTTEGRFAMGVDAYTILGATMGAEVAVQSGNIVRLKVPSTFLDAAGGLPLQTVLKPFPDLLLFLRYKFLSFSLFAKGGIAYRQLQFENRTSRKDILQRINGDFQAGFNYHISPSTRLTIFYQGIYSKNTAGVTLGANNNLLLGQIPTQQAGWFGIECAL